MISKERLWEILRCISQRGCATLSSFQCGRLSMVESLIEECGEDDTLTVSKLRPMSEVKDFGGDIQVFYSGNYRQSEIYYWDDQLKWYFDINPLPLGIDDDCMLGFIPAVKYKP